MESSQKNRYYIINHMDEFLFEWSLCEYLQINSYLQTSEAALPILSNSDTFFKYSSKNSKHIAQNKENIDILLNSKTRFNFLPSDIGDYLQDSNHTLKFSIDSNEISLDFSRVCLLDMRAEVQLTPNDINNFDCFIFGGILGDHPPRDRTSALRAKGFALRNLGVMQMATDTALLVTSLIIEKGRKYESIEFVDEPELLSPKKVGVQESVQIEGFRYVKKGYDIETGELKEKSDEPKMNEKIREVLIFKELDLEDFL